MITTNTNLRVLWLQFRGLQLGVTEAVRERGGYRWLTTKAVALVLQNRRIPQKADERTVWLIKEAAWRHDVLLGEGPEAELFRTYLKLLDWRLWERAARQSGIKLSIIQSTLQGDTKNPRVMEALRAAVVAAEEERLAAAEGPARMKLVKSARRYRGVVSDVAREIGVSKQAVSQVVLGKKTSARIATALARKALRIEREITSQRSAP